MKSRGTQVIEISGRAAEGFALPHDARFQGAGFRGAGFRGAGRVKEIRIGAAPCGDFAGRGAVAGLCCGAEVMTPGREARQIGHPRIEFRG